jgi:chorismate-pyruvate lyase
MLRIDLRESLCQSAVDPQLLSSFQRILLTTDGTVTEILEAHLWEAIRIVKLHQECLETDASVPYLDIGPHAPVLIRKIILRGKPSDRNYIYAESIVALDRLDDRLRHGLIETQKPVGQLMLEARLETFREILSCCLEPAEEIGVHFGIGSDATLISRTYRVFANKQPFMLITEKFPETAFRD